MKNLLVDVYQVCSNKSPRVKIGPVPGVIDFPYMYYILVVKTFKKTCENPKDVELRYLA
jgi:hypothetical protein